MNRHDVYEEVREALDVIESPVGNLRQAQMILRKALITLEYAIDAESRGFRSSLPFLRKSDEEKP